MWKAFFMVIGLIYHKKGRKTGENPLLYFKTMVEFYAETVNIAFQR